MEDTNTTGGVIIEGFGFVSDYAIGLAVTHIVTEAHEAGLTEGEFNHAEVMERAMAIQSDLDN